MRVPALLAISLFVVPSFAADQPVSASPSAQPQSQLTTLREGAAIDNASLISPDSQDGACFKMRTYVVKREGIGDSTRLVKYYTCQRASKYGVKRAAGDRDKDER